MTEPAPLMAGKRGLIMGVANERSLAWGIARTAHAHGADLAFTYQGEVLRRRVVPLEQGFGVDEIVGVAVVERNDDRPAGHPSCPRRRVQIGERHDAAEASDDVQMFIEVRRADRETLRIALEVNYTVV